MIADWFCPRHPQVMLVRVYGRMRRAPKNKRRKSPRHHLSEYCEACRREKFALVLALALETRPCCRPTTN